MKITLKCKCGVEAIFEDRRGTYINPSGDTDDKGRVYLVQVDVDEWLEMHKCGENHDCTLLVAAT